jgi:hypothetical protein
MGQDPIGHAHEDTGRDRRKDLREDHGDTRCSKKRRGLLSWTPGAVPYISQELGGAFCAERL